jgi:hypothetical protein
VRVRVTAAHIADGKQRRVNKCMLVLAVQDSFPDARYVRVRDATVRVTDKQTGLRHYYRMNYDTLITVATYDSPAGKKVVKPFNFTLDGRNVSKTFKAGSSHRQLSSDRHKKSQERLKLRPNRKKQRRATNQRIAGAAMLTCAY